MITPSTIRAWYDLSKQETLTAFYTLLPALTVEIVKQMLAQQTRLRPRGSLRTPDDLAALERQRTPIPSVADLQAKGDPSEYALKCFFVHRGYFVRPTQRVRHWELPTCCTTEAVTNWADLFVLDDERSCPIIVELKRGETGNPLTGAILESLSHWAFLRQHQEAFKAFLDELEPGKAWETPSIAVAAPQGYFGEVQRKTRKPRGAEYRQALTWIDGLRDTVTIDLYEVDDTWLTTGVGFRMTPHKREAPA